MEQQSFNLLRDIEIVLRSRIDDNTSFDEIVQKLSFVLNNYEINKKTTDLVPYNDENIRILNRYKACLLVEGKSIQTIEAYSYRIKHMYETSHVNLKDVGPYDIRFYLAILKQHGCSNHTLETIRAYIAAFYKWMVIEEIIDKNPCAPIKPIKFTSEVKKAFSEVEMELLRSNCKSIKERALIEILASTGIRVSELVNLDIVDVNFQHNTILVRHGKGDKERIVYMSPVAAYYLKKYLDTRKDNGVELFRSNMGRLKDGGVRYILKEIGDRAGVEKVHPHRFRRTFATNLNSKGMAIQNIQTLLGHSKLDTTMIYVDVDDNAVKSEYVKFMAS